MQQKYGFRVLVATLLGIRLFMDLFVVVRDSGQTLDIDRISLHKQYADLMNPDDREISRTAKYVLQGKGFLTDISYDKPDFRPGGLTLSALRPKYQIYAHLLAIRLYTLAKPGYSVFTEGNLPADYYGCFATAVLVMKNIFLLVSVFYFYRLSRILFKPAVAKIALCCYLLYPSLCFFIGIMNLHDCTVTYCLVIIVSMLAENYHQYRFRTRQAVFVGFLMIVTLLKSQAILSLAFLMVLLFVLYLPKPPMHVWRFLLIANAIFIAALLPVFYQNHRDFGGFFLTTQSGVTFFHGHNPLARGSWYPGIWNADGGSIRKLLEPHRKALSAGELSESQVYSHLAMDWIKENPGKEAVLLLRKTAIFLLPHNYLNWRINLFTLFGHLGLIGFGVLAVFRWRTMNKVFWFAVVPVISVLLVNLLFFVEYRWRLFADPFIILCAVHFYATTIGWYVAKRENINASVSMP